MARLAGSLIAIITLAVMAGFVIARTWTVNENMAKNTVSVPESIASKHHALLTALQRALRSGGETGLVAVQVRNLLAAHFAREESMALPPLGALLSLTQGDLPEDTRSRVVQLSADLQEELPSMLREHRLITDALQNLHDVARTEQKNDIAELAVDLIEYAKNEEEVFYPAAILVGDYLRIKDSG